MAKKYGTGSPVGPKTIVIPIEDIEALLVAVSTSNRTAIIDITNKIREFAEKQAPDKF